MLESVLKSFSSSHHHHHHQNKTNRSDISSNNNNNNSDYFIEDPSLSLEEKEKRRRKFQLFEVEKMLHEDAKLKNVRLRSPVGVTNSDTIISMRQLMTALYVLKGGKNFVVVV